MPGSVARIGHRMSPLVYACARGRGGGGGRRRGQRFARQRDAWTGCSLARTDEEGASTQTHLFRAQAAPKLLPLRPELDQEELRVRRLVVVAVGQVRRGGLLARLEGSGARRRRRSDRGRVGGEGGRHLEAGVGGAEC